MEQLKKYIRFNEIAGVVKLESNGIVVDIDKSWWYSLCKREGVSTQAYKILKDMHDYTGAKYLDVGGNHDWCLYPWNESRQCYYGNTNRREIVLK